MFKRGVNTYGERVLVSAKVKNTGTVSLGHTRVTIGTGEDRITLNIGTLNLGQAKSATVNRKRNLAAGETYTAMVTAKPASLMEGLVAWYRFDSGSGNTVHDRSENGNDGTLKGDPKWVDGWIGDGALEFDGVDDWIGVPGFPNFQTNFTIFARIKTSNNAEAGQRIFADDESNTGGYALSLGDPGSGALRFYSRDMDTGCLDTAAGVIKEDKQYPVAAIADISNNNRFIYVKEKIKAEPLSDTGVWGTDSGKASIGGETDQGETGNRFVGTIDEVMFFNRALSPREIKTLAGGGGVVTRVVKITVSLG